MGLVDLPVSTLVSKAPHQAPRPYFRSLHLSALKVVSVACLEALYLSDLKAAGW